ncbi:DEAD/DEAH box helicase [Acrocarpospora catenulata]|uniref:DEAD/DEAH box helicase n=1 Tax=Acrocarpospora catenulata TaxID=2836182 RepID=UPI001BDA8DA4|nr:DEAD/DEAH box helicase [Acrocarpospora catenulata]
MMREDGQFTPREANALCRSAEELLAKAGTLLRDHEVVRGLAARTLGALRVERARAELATVPVARIKDVTEGRLRISALEEAGYATVLDVCDASVYRLHQVPGIGVRSARQILAAANQIAQAAVDAVSIRVDADRRDTPTTDLLIALQTLVQAGPDLNRTVRVARQFSDRLGPLLAVTRPARSRLRGWIAGSRRRERAQAALSEIAEVLAGAPSDIGLLLAQVTADLLIPPVPDVVAWADFAYRPAEYYALLTELAGEPVTAGLGLLPDDLVARVIAQELDDTHRRVSLRGYQAFGARFALAQGRVILGDQMGLGKTIEAIAALAHLRSENATHFLVICPTSVLINWVREIENRSALPAYGLHGPFASEAQAEWVRRGGVAVVTLGSVHRLEIPTEVAVGMLVVDEAHLVKNRQARRSKAVERWCGRVERVLFLTGTPMENRVEEFRTLISYLRPTLAENLRASDVVAGAQAFRKAVAPAYLRRNQEDVLAELPMRVDSEDWIELSDADVAAYRAAVVRRNFMAMRRAAYAVPATSAKLRRLLELVEDARDNSLKVLVFSYFRDVLATVAEALGGAVHGPISGAVTPARRQQIVDAFSAAAGHAVLLSQIEAGGTGLNIQAASVVILCEPQLKPSVESQAVARVHRMGQIRTVQVHRLLAVDSVDQRLLELLDAKERLFQEYAHRSDLAERTPDALDISDQSLAQQIIEEEQRRLMITSDDLRNAEAQDAGSA